MSIYEPGPEYKFDINDLHLNARCTISDYKIDRLLNDFGIGDKHDLTKTDYYAYYLIHVPDEHAGETDVVILADNEIAKQLGSDTPPVLSGILTENTDGLVSEYSNQLLTCKSGLQPDSVIFYITFLTGIISFLILLQHWLRRSHEIATTFHI